MLFRSTPSAPPPPPVPETLREQLKDYPELIEELQFDLKMLLKQRVKGNIFMILDRALWRLKDSLCAHYVDAKEEFEDAKAHGDEEAMERAQEKKMRISYARLAIYSDDLLDYFKKYEKFFQ